MYKTMPYSAFLRSFSFRKCSHPGYRCLHPDGHICYSDSMVTRNSSEVIALLKEASKKYEQTIIMITHNRSIAQTADRVLQVSDGVLTDFGRCRE